MNLHTLLATNNDCYKANRKITPTGVLWHSTGANNPYLKRYVGPNDGLLGENKYRNYWNRPNLAICCHAFIGLLENGDVATYQILPWNHRGWHAGGSANDRYIGFEICEDNLKNKDYAMSVYAEAVELTAYLCKMFNINPYNDNAIIDHAKAHQLGMASNHGDVLHWFGRYGITLKTIVSDVATAMILDTEKPTPPSGWLIRLPKGTPIYDKPPTDFIEADGVFTVIDESNGFIKLKSGVWVKKP